VIQHFRDKETKNIYDGTHSKVALKRLPVHLWKTAYRKFYALDNAVSLYDLKSPPNNRLEALKGDRKGQYSIRINDQYRVCFSWTPLGPDSVEIVDYH
jgi:toxin HigB-1